MKNSRKFILNPTIIVLSFLMGIAIASAAHEKTKITRADQLDRRNIALIGDVPEIYNEDARLKEIADKVYANTTDGRATFYANGFGVESSVLCGKRLKFSVTSMASPQLANLAGKIIALKPNLTPKQVVAIIRSTATPDPEGNGLLLIHPKAAIKSLRK